MAVIKLESLVLRGVRVIRDAADLKRIGSGVATQPPTPALSFPVRFSASQVDHDPRRQDMNPAVRRAGRPGSSLGSPRSAARLAAAQACFEAWRERLAGHRQGQFGLKMPAARYRRTALLAGTFAASTREEQVG